jgi:hypothetical protein
MGHRIVTGGTIGKSAGITAAGMRLLFSRGWDKGNWETAEKVLRGKRKGKPRIAKGAFRNAFTGAVMRPGDTFEGKRIRGGGKVLFRPERGAGALMTRPFPMLRPAFEDMKRPMMLAIENELRKIEGEAERLAKNPQKRQWLDNPVV